MASEDPTAASAAPILIDLGKHGRKRVKQLRDGRGPLMGEVAQCVDELKASGALGPDATPVVIVVRQRPRKRAGWPLG
jgi:hypothetical protein